VYASFLNQTNELNY